MASKFRAKLPSLDATSTALTYVALTGVLLAPLATASPRLPAAVEAKAAALPLPKTPIQPPPQQATAQDVAAAAPLAANAAEIEAAQATTGELRDVEPIQVAEARSRLKSVKAKDRKEPVEAKPETKPDEPAADPPKDDTATHEPQPPAETADVEIKETAKSAKANQAAKTKDGDKAAKLPPPSAIVPVAKTEPVNAAPTAAAAEPTVWTDTEIAAALKECLRLLAPVNAEIEVNPSLRKGQCGTPAPILLKSVGNNPKVTFQPAVEINCQMAVALGEWATTTMQPAARNIYGSEVRSIVGASGYSCRNRYGLANEKLSEHALANAIDIGGFALANGRAVKVSGGWGITNRDRVAAAKTTPKTAEKTAEKADEKAEKSLESIKTEPKSQKAALKPSDLAATKAAPKELSKDKVPVLATTKAAEIDGTKTPDGQFLRRLHEGACETFGTVLGPEANEAHRDHLHFDLKARKHRAVCQ